MWKEEIIFSTSFKTAIFRHEDQLSPLSTTPITYYYLIKT